MSIWMSDQVRMIVASAIMGGTQIVIGDERKRHGKVLFYAVFTYFLLMAFYAIGFVRGFDCKRLVDLFCGSDSDADKSD